MNVEQLENAGLTYVEPFTYHIGRGKSHGAMWDAKAVLEDERYEYYCKAWYHGGDEMTEAVMKQVTGLSGLKRKSDGKYFDLYWYAIQNNGVLWLREHGWFGFEPGKEELKTAVRHLRNNFTQAEVEALGFECLIPGQ